LSPAALAGRYISRKTSQQRKALQINKLSTEPSKATSSIEMDVFPALNFPKVALSAFIIQIVEVGTGCLVVVVREGSRL
jgi:hypothetical protein